MTDLTICITTHCIKTENISQTNLWPNLVRSMPSTILIETILKDLFEKTDLEIDTKIHIGFDKRKGRDIDNQYEKNLSKLQDKYPGLKVIVHESESYDPQITMPASFTKLIDSVETKYYMFWEHDWLFVDQIRISDILTEMDSNDKINWIRFNQFNNNNDFIPIIAEEFIDNNIAKIPLLPCLRWSNNPYICRTSIFQNWWKTFVYVCLEEGGQMEGAVCVFFDFYVKKQGLQKTLEEFKCFIYGKWNDMPTVHHLEGNSYLP